MANPQPTDAHLRISHSIQEEIMMRDFTKRQRAILDLILRLSWGCNKKSAVIPKQRDFELVGVSENKIKSELEWLCNAKVIIWSRETNEYEFIKNYDEWKVSIVNGYNRDRLNELLTINIQTSQNGKLLAESATSPKGKKLAETGRNDTFQNGNILPEKARNFPSRGEEDLPSKSTESQDGEVSKESIKEINSSSGSSIGKMFKFFHDNICSLPASFQYEELNHYLDEGLSPEAIIEAMKDSVGAKFNKWNFLQKILKDCIENKALTVEQYNIRKAEREKEAKSRDRPPDKPPKKSGSNNPFRDRLRGTQNDGQ